MAKRVVLRFDGKLEQGFQTTLEIGEDGALSFSDVTGTLPPAPELAACLNDWQQHYRQLSAPTRISLQQITVRAGSGAHLQACRQHAQDLQQHLNTWLASPSFHAVEKQLRESLELTEPVRVLLRTTDLRLHRLPWHAWEFIERYTQAEVALSTPPARAVERTSRSSNVRILAILGDRRGIDTDRDRQLLATLPHAEVLFLVEPSRQQLNQQLWDQAWDILFFAGHSNTESTQGRLHLNPEDSLAIAELKYGLRQAISRGLQLAIFNSCDGLGLAYELEQLHLPQLIVMREPVPDRVAQEFLKYFLTAFAQDKSLYQAVREARERLQGLEGQYPCATWLPIIVQNPAVVPPSWQSLQGSQEELQIVDCRLQSEPTDRQSKIFNLQSSISLFLTSFAVTVLILGMRFMGLLQPLEVAAFDHLLQLRPDEPPDPRLLVVLVTNEDVQAQPQEHRRGSLSDPTLDQLLQKLEAYQPKVIGLDIYRDYSVGQGGPQLADRLRQRDHLVAVCKVGDAETKESGVAPPPEVPTAQVGFSDFVPDSGNIIRRHLLAMTPAPSSRCAAPYALNVQLALRYLKSQGISLQYPNPETWQLGKLHFQPLRAHQGGYQRIDDRGHQLLLNYRSPEKGVRHVTLGQVLSGQLQPEAVKNRIVLIGTIAEGTYDYWLTPYRTAHGDRQKVPGVILQAQMTSQLLSAVLDGRPLLWTWALWAELLWVGGWALLGGLLALYIRKPTYLGLVMVGAIAALFSSCLLLLIQTGAWVPLIPSAIALITSGIGVKAVEVKKQQIF
ncbi:MAG: CHASE2 domain-containing protein [Leptolyngbyaceae cyanobacterium RU_5_1]|nr:CHASE2 domain-containing protein [Leptolyngbyaceae cyanobacterium RU_5_1]